MRDLQIINREQTIFDSALLSLHSVPNAVLNNLINKLIKLFSSFIQQSGKSYLSNKCMVMESLSRVHDVVETFRY